jgi:hypothetical protein
MTGSVYLGGSEDVSRAGSQIRQAADQMQKAGDSIAYSSYDLKQFMNDWLDRFRQVLEDDREARR